MRGTHRRVHCVEHRSAVAFAREKADVRPLPIVSKLKVEYPNADAYFQFARNTVGAMARNFPAPLKCVDAVAASTKMKFEDGMKLEREIFMALMLTPESKALRHAFPALPHDLLCNLTMESVQELVTTAMSLADRPRPTLLLARSILKGNMFAFVWLPRDELTPARRLAIGEMIREASEGRISNWSVELGDGDLALIRYTLYIGPETPTPDVPAPTTLAGHSQGVDA